MRGVILLVAIAAATIVFLFGRKTKPITNVTNKDVPAPNSPSAAHSEVSLVKVFEVFLSFCGKDTRNGFTDFLYTYLKDANIETFRDDNELRVGEKIGPELLKAIRESKISIPVFSRNYAFSKWCLLELSEMVDCHKNGGHMIYPIFYDVAPFEVRHQYGSYEKAFQEHKKKFDKETVKRWREALRMVGELKGLELKKETNGQEGKLVKMVVEKVLLDLKKNYTILPENLVGIDAHLEKIKELLDAKFKGVRVVVVHGMGGLGKTTIAKVAFNQLHASFDNHCLLDNVREKWEHNDGILDLQNQLISKIKNREFSKITSDANEGRDTIKGTVSGKKVILVLDDVDNISQVNMLMGKLSWYGAQSRIIITTRDEDVLRAMEKTCQIEGLNDVCTGYKPKYMDGHDSLQLFSKYAFMRDCPAEGYERLSEEVIGIAAGLPLVLVVLGSTFFALEGKGSWYEKLKRLREFPNKKVIDKLRFSFDALEYTEKQIFLDIACLFTGENVTRLGYMWDDCGFHAKDGINVLVRKSLITVNEYNHFEMHDQLRGLGRQIVREQSVNELGKQSRFWGTEQAMEILETNQGTTSVNALCLPYSSESPVLASSFKNMQNLRYLHMGFNYLDGDFKDILLGLRWLTIYRFRKGWPTDLHLKHLLILELYNNDFIKDLRDFKIGDKLKVLRLSSCSSVRLLNMFMHSSLEILEFYNCDLLCAIDGLEKLKSLKHLKAWICPALEKVCLSDLTNLCELDFFNCRQLVEIQGLETLESLQELSIDCCPSLKELPDLSNLKNLKRFKVISCTKLVEIQGLENLESLQELDIHRCTSLKELPHLSNLRRLERINVDSLDDLKIGDKLKVLELSDCRSVRVLNMSMHPSLEILALRYCDSLCAINGLEKLKSLKRLAVANCHALEKICLSNLTNLCNLELYACGQVVEIQGLETLESLQDLCISLCPSLKELPDLSNLKRLEWFDVDSLDASTEDETSDSSTEDQDPLTCLVDPLNSVYEHEYFEDETSEDQDPLTCLGLLASAVKRSQTMTCPKIRQRGNIFRNLKTRKMTMLRERHPQYSINIPQDFFFKRQLKNSFSLYDVYTRVIIVPCLVEIYWI